MKKHLVILLTAFALLASTESASAQNWGDLFKKAGAAVADAVTGGKYSENAMQGRWVYAAPAMKMESAEGDALSGLAGVALERTAAKKMTKVYEKVGLKPGVGILTLMEDGKYEATTGERTIKGTYTFDAKQHLTTFAFDTKIKKVQPVEGKVYVKGDELTLVFPVTRLVEMVKAIGDRIPQLAGLSQLFEKYENIYIGFKFQKQAE